MKIYTKTGDKGMTALYSGKRVQKDNIRIEAYGTIDELMSFMGVLASSTKDNIQLEDIERTLYEIGCYLANEEATSSGITDDNIAQLEQRIDQLDASLPPLHNFIIPGGTTAASMCHVCRTICRRAERRMITLRNSLEDKMDDNSFIYINRLSDYFFLLARKLNHNAGVQDVIL